MKQRIRKVQSHFRFHILLSLKVKYYPKRITNLFQYWGTYLLPEITELDAQPVPEVTGKYNGLLDENNYQ